MIEHVEWASEQRVTVFSCASCRLKWPRTAIHTSTQRSSGRNSPWRRGEHIEDRRAWFSRFFRVVRGMRDTRRVTHARTVVAPASPRAVWQYLVILKVTATLIGSRKSSTQSPSLGECVRVNSIRWHFVRVINQETCFLFQMCRSLRRVRFPGA